MINRPNQEGHDAGGAGVKPGGEAELVVRFLL